MQGIINMSKAELQTMRISLKMTLAMIEKKLLEEERGGVSTSPRPKGKRPVKAEGVQKVKSNRLKAIYR